MSDQNVSYSLSLNDMLSGKIKVANHEVNALEGSLHHAAGEAKSFGAELIGALGIGFAVFKGVQFVEEGVHGMHELEQSVAQVKAGLASTGEAAGLTFDELEEQARSLASALPYSRAQIMDMQAQLLTFPSVAKETFGEASQAILDMASRTHRGTNEIAIMVGKALQDPTKGVTALRRVGVNFNAAQTEIIKKLAETGQAGKAQALILKELNLEFAGSAKAAADADPLFRYNKIMASIKMEVGELAIKLLKHLTPALEWIANTTKSVVHWMIEHKGLIIAVTAAVGTMAAGWMAYLVVTNAVTVATRIWTAVQFLLNAVMAANPITWLIVGIGLLVGAIVYCYNKFDWFRGGVYAAWATLKGLGAFISESFMAILHGLATTLHGVFTLDFHEIKAGFVETAKGLAAAAMDLGKKASEGYREGVMSMGDTHKASPTNLKHSVKAMKGEAGEAGKSESAKAVGSKKIDIKISIGTLVGKVENHMTTIKGNMDSMKDQVAAALMSAINDSQIVAGS